MSKNIPNSDSDRNHNNVPGFVLTNYWIFSGWLAVVSPLRLIWCRKRICSEEQQQAIVKARHYSNQEWQYTFYSNLGGSRRRSSIMAQTQKSPFGKIQNHNEYFVCSVLKWTNNISRRGKCCLLSSSFIFLSQDSQSQCANDKK